MLEEIALDPSKIFWDFVFISLIFRKASYKLLKNTGFGSMKIIPASIHSLWVSLSSWAVHATMGM